MRASCNASAATGMTTDWLIDLFIFVQTEEGELQRISNKVRFILAVIAGEVVVSNRKRADIEAALDALGFDRLTNPKKASAVSAVRAAARDRTPSLHHAAHLVVRHFHELMSIAPDARKAFMQEKQLMQCKKSNHVFPDIITQPVVQPVIQTQSLSQAISPSITPLAANSYLLCVGLTPPALPAGA